MVSVWRAWLIGHRAVRGMVVLAVLTVGTVLFASLRLESVLASSPFPVWGMFPPTVAAVAGTMCVNRLPVLRPRSRQVVLARTYWVLLMMVVFSLASLSVATAADYRSLMQETLVLVAMTAGASCAVGRACVCLGLAIDAAVATMGADSRFMGLDFWYAGLGSAGRVAILAGAGACLLAYAALGPREDSAEARSDD